MAVTKPEPDLTEEAKQLIIKEREERIKQCQTAVNELLAKYKCSLDVKMEISVNKIVPIVAIVAIE